MEVKVQSNLWDVKLNDMPQLSIIIVNYNVKEFVKNLLYSLEKALRNFSAEIIIVDNASSDGSVDDIKNKFPNVTLIANEKNVGFGKANNQGLEIAQGKYIVLLNPDTIVREDTFTKLIEFMEENTDAGMVTCKVLNPDGTLQLACRRSYPGPWVSFTKVTGLSKLFPKSKLFARYNLTYLDEDKVSEVDAVSGSFMMFKKEVYEKVGGFDPRFFMYGEDLDLCYRVKSSGYKVYYVPVTEIIHYKGESTKRSSIDETKIFYEAMHLFVEKHFSSSFLVELILRSAIVARRFVAFINLYRLPIISALVDFVVFSVALYIAEQLYRPGNWSGFPESVKPWIYIVPAFMQTIFTAFIGGYKRSSISTLRVLLALIVGLIVSSSVTFFFKQYAYSRAVLLITYSVAIVAFIIWRFVVKVFFNVGNESSVRGIRTLIVGDEQRCRELGEKLKSTFADLYSVFGFISEKTEDIGKKIGNYEIIGSLENISKVIQEKNINRVIFASENISFEKMFSVVSLSNKANVEFLVAGTELDYLVGKSSVTMLENIPLLKVHYNIANIGHRIIKNIFDVLLSIPMLIFIYPFYLIASLFVKIKSDFGKFILGVPSVLTLRKSFVGTMEQPSENGLYLGKQGLTGLWYIENFNRLDSKELEKLNIYYAKNQNIWLDLEILGKTFAKMFSKKD